MRPWKAVLGIGAACAACCAMPLVGGVAAPSAGTAALAASGSALLTGSEEFAPFGTGLLVLAGVGGAITWCGPLAATEPRARSGRSCGSHAMPGGAALPQVVGPSPRKACGCNPGTCG